MSQMCALVAQLVFQVSELHAGGVTQKQAFEYMRSVSDAIARPIVVNEYSQVHTVDIQTRMTLAQLSCETTYERSSHGRHSRH